MSQCPTQGYATIPAHFRHNSVTILSGNCHSSVKILLQFCYCNTDSRYTIRLPSLPFQSNISPVVEWREGAGTRDSAPREHCTCIERQPNPRSTPYSVIFKVTTVHLEACDVGHSHSAHLSKPYLRDVLQVSVCGKMKIWASIRP